MNLKRVLRLIEFPLHSSNAHRILSWCKTFSRLFISFKKRNIIRKEYQKSKLGCFFSQNVWKTLVSEKKGFWSQFSTTVSTYMSASVFGFEFSIRFRWFEGNCVGGVTHFSAHCFVDMSELNAEGFSFHFGVSNLILSKKFGTFVIYGVQLFRLTNLFPVAKNQRRQLANSFSLHSPTALIKFVANFFVLCWSSPLFSCSWGWLTRSIFLAVEKIGHGQVDENSWNTRFQKISLSSNLSYHKLRVWSDHAV